MDTFFIQTIMTILKKKKDKKIRELKSLNASLKIFKNNCYSSGEIQVPSLIWNTDKSNDPAEVLGKIIKSFSKDTA